MVSLYLSLVATSPLITSTSSIDNNTVPAQKVNIKYFCHIKCCILPKATEKDPFIIIQL